jgi:hypothetical protein
MKGRSKSSGLDREGDSPAERSPEAAPTEGRPGAANLNALSADPKKTSLPVFARQKPFPVREGGMYSPLLVGKGPGEGSPDRR